MLDSSNSLNQINTKSSNITTEPDINIELYSTGFFDGLNGLNAQLPHFKDYWSGYQIGYREYCCGLLGVEIPLKEISTERLIGEAKLVF